MSWNQNSGKRFERCTIAKAKRGDGWSFEGYVAIVDGVFAGIVSFAIDSYVDYFSGATTNAAGDIDFDWVGTPEELIRIAKLDTDLMFPDRVRNSNDSDYEIISDLYKGILKWAKKHNRYWKLL